MPETTVGAHAPDLSPFEVAALRACGGLRSFGVFVDACGDYGVRPEMMRTWRRVLSLRLLDPSFNLTPAGRALLAELGVTW